MSRGKKKVIKCFVVIVCVCIISVLVCISPIFNVRNIKVNGNTYYDDSRIIEIIGIRIGDNWFKKVAESTRVSFKNALVHRYFEGEKNIKESCPYVKDVRISLSGIGEYSIKIKEREPVAKVSYLAEYIVIDDCGVALDIVEDKKDDVMPKINGLSLTNVNLGEKIGIKEEKIEAFCKIYDIIKKSDGDSKEKFYRTQREKEVYNEKSKEQLYSYIDYIDFGDLRDIKLFLDKRILVYFGDIDGINEHKINYLKEVFFNNIDDKEEGVLNFRAKKNPTFTKKVYAKIMNEEVGGKKC